LPGIFKQESFVKGVWKRNDQEIDLSDGNMFTEKMTVTGETLKVGNNTYYLISDRSFLLNVAKNYSFITNVYKQRKNKTDRNMIVNGGSFGVGKACQISGECSIID